MHCLSSQIYIRYSRQRQDLIDGGTSQGQLLYRKVTITKMFCLEPHQGIYILLLNGTLDVYVLWGKVDFLIRNTVNTCNFAVLFLKTFPGTIPGPNVSTTPLRQWGFRQCLSFSWTTLRGKHCRHPIAVMGVVDTLGPGLLKQDYLKKN